MTIEIKSLYDAGLDITNLKTKQKKYVCLWGGACVVCDGGKRVEGFVDLKNNVTHIELQWHMFNQDCFKIPTELDGSMEQCIETKF